MMLELSENDVADIIESINFFTKSINETLTDSALRKFLSGSEINKLHLQKERLNTLKKKIATQSATLAIDDFAHQLRTGWRG